MYKSTNEVINKNQMKNSSVKTLTKEEIEKDYPQSLLDSWFPTKQRHITGYDRIIKEQMLNGWVRGTTDLDEDDTWNENRVEYVE